MNIERLLSLALVAVQLSVLWRLPRLLHESAGWDGRLALAILLVGIVLCLAHGLALAPGAAALVRLIKPPLPWATALAGLITAAIVNYL